MDVLVNASILTKGGGIQVAASFVVESQINPKGQTWHYALSRQVADEVDGLGIRLANVEVFDVSPARSRKQRKRLKALEKNLQVDAVFTIFGPAYVKFSAPHLLGVAVGWVTHSTWLAYRTIPGWPEKLKAFLTSVYKGWWLRRAERWVVEAENARRGLKSRLGVPADRVDVVPNMCSNLFAEAALAPATRPVDSDLDPVRLLYVSAYYPHKNIEFVPEVAAALRNLCPGRAFKFILTLPPADAEKVLGVARKLDVVDCIDNVGKVSLSKLPELYRNSDICFMPSVLETFSATYVEAMATGRPIVASDLDFAHAVCEDSAVYFDPRDRESAAEGIIELLDDGGLWRDCIERGKDRLNALPTASQRYDLYVSAIKATVTGDVDITAATERET